MSPVEGLDSVLEHARRRGFLGPGPVSGQVRHALDMGAAIEGTGLIDAATGCAVDLGSGGGVPGLPLALLWPTSSWVLLDSNLARTAFLRDAVAELGLGGRVKVVRQRAEDAGRGPLRGRFDLVTARAFAGPAATAECGAPLLRRGGLLAVSEPPGGAPGRWDPDGLALLGSTPGPSVTEPAAFQLLLQRELCPDRFPRRSGVPAKRPLF